MHSTISSKVIQFNIEKWQLQCLIEAPLSQTSIFISSTPFYNLSTNSRPHQNVKQLKQQHFDFFVVIDFEATCEANPPPIDKYIQEIIEFPIVIVDAHNGTIVTIYFICNISFTSHLLG